VVAEEERPRALAGSTAGRSGQRELEPEPLEEVSDARCGAAAHLAGGDDAQVRGGGGELVERRLEAPTCATTTTQGRIARSTYSRPPRPPSLRLEATRRRD
jgi:hypothetical protein